MKILFVCLGNLCRSPIAEAIASRRAAELRLAGTFAFASAGTHPPRLGAPADARARQVGERRGYDLSRHRTRRVTAADFAAFDAMLAMDRDVLTTLQAIAPPGQTAQVALLLAVAGGSGGAGVEVPDPYYGSLAGFERVFDMCEQGVEAILRSLPGGGPFGLTLDGGPFA